MPCLFSFHLLSLGSDLAALSICTLLELPVFFFFLSALFLFGSTHRAGVWGCHDQKTFQMLADDF